MKKTVKKTKKQAMIDYLSTHAKGFTVAEGNKLFKTAWCAKLVAGARKDGVKINGAIDAKGAYRYTLAAKKASKKK